MIDRSRPDESLDFAAMALFAERGFGNTPVPLIARRAGVAAGTIYLYFPSKDALANAIYHEGKLALAERLPRDLPDEHAGDPAGRLEWRRAFGGWWGALWDFAAEHALLFGFLETHHHAAYLDDRSRAVARAIDDAAEGFIRAGQRAGVLRAGDPAALLALVFGSFVGLARAGLLTEARRDLSEDAAWGLLAASSPRS